VAESEVYRQTLTLEIQSLRLYSLRVQRTVALLRLANPLLRAAGSLSGTRFLSPGPRRKRRGKWSRLLGTSLMGWRLYLRVGRFFPWGEYPIGQPKTKPYIFPG